MSPQPQDRAIAVDVFHALQAGLLVCNARGEVILANRAAASILHLDHIAPGTSLASLLAPMDQLCRSGLRSRPELAIQRADGPQVLGYRVEPTEGGRRIVIFQDITAQRPLAANSLAAAEHSIDIFPAQQAEEDQLDQLLPVDATDLPGAAYDVDLLERPLPMEPADHIAKEVVNIMARRTEEGAAFSLPECVQLAGQGRHSVKIEVVSSGVVRGWLSLVDGELWAASCGELRGEEAVRSLLLMMDVHMEVESMRGNAGDRELNMPVEVLLVDAFRLLDAGLDDELALNSLRPTARPPATQRAPISVPPPRVEAASTRPAPVGVADAPQHSVVTPAKSETLVSALSTSLPPSPLPSAGGNPVPNRPITRPIPQVPQPTTAHHRPLSANQPVPLPGRSAGQAKDAPARASAPSAATIPAAAAQPGERPALVPTRAPASGRPGVSSRSPVAPSAQAAGPFAAPVASGSAKVNQPPRPAPALLPPSDVSFKDWAVNGLLEPILRREVPTAGPADNAAGRGAAPLMPSLPEPTRGGPGRRTNRRRSKSSQADEALGRTADDSVEIVLEGPLPSEPPAGPAAATVATGPTISAPPKGRPAPESMPPKARAPEPLPPRAVRDAQAPHRTKTSSPAPIAPAASAAPAAPSPVAPLRATGPAASAEASAMPAEAPAAQAPARPAESVDFDALINRGREAILMRNFSEANQVFELAARLRPDHPGIEATLARLQVLVQTGRGNPPGKA